MTATFLAAQDPWSARVDAVSPGVDGNRVSTIPWSWPLGTRHVGTRLAGQPTHAPHVHPSLQGVWSPDCGVRADRGRGRGDCRRTRRGVLRTPPHPTAPGSLVDLRGRSGGLTGHAHERTKATTPSSTSGSRSARATCSGGRQTGRERLHIRGSQLAPSDVKLQGAVSFANDLHFHSNLRPAVPGHLDDAGAVEGLLLVNLLFPASGVVLLLLVFGRLHRAPSLWEWTIVALSLGFTPLLTAQNLFLARRKNATVGGSKTYVFDESGQALDELRGLLHRQTGTRARLLQSATGFPPSLASG